MTDVHLNNEQKTGKVRLSPPWITFQRTLSFTIGQSTQVMVSELSGDGPEYRVKVVTFDRETAQALANVVESTKDLGNIKVIVEIFDIDGNKYPPTERTPSLQDLKRATFNNPLVYDVAERTIGCQPKVVQFWNDDISNPQGFTSKLAAEAFKEVVVSVVDTYTAAGSST